MDIPLVQRLSDPARPVFLLGDVPPCEGTPPGQCQAICDKFAARSRTLATDGFIVYDIQDEPGRQSGDGPDQGSRPFPFRRLMDSSPYGAMLARTSGKECLVYKCVADPNFEAWCEKASREHGHSAINLVGRPSSEGTYQGPTLGEAMEKVHASSSSSSSSSTNVATTAAARLQFGCVCIAERHTLESATARGKDYPTEHQNMLRKQKAGADWFISQAVYDTEPTIRLLKDYAALCRQQGVAPRKVVLTFAPVSRTKTMNFIKWLGVKVPTDVEENILKADKPVEESIHILCRHLTTILAECRGIGVPLGVSCESVSIYKAEIDGVHELFRRLQGILLDSRGSPWKVQWVDTGLPPLGAQPKHPSLTITEDGYGLEKKGENKNNVDKFVSPTDAVLLGAAIGGTLVGLGVMLGSATSRNHFR